MTNQGDSQEQRFVEAVDGIRMVMLTTLAGDEPHARPMAVQETEDDGTVWLLSSADSHKVRQVQEHPHVGLVYVDGGTYVSATGRATVSRDEERKRELWNPWAEAWLQCDPEDDKAVLIRVEVTGAELWEAPNPVTRTVSAATALVLRRPPRVGDSETVHLGATGASVARDGDRARRGW
jgi:general stress protein 26